MAETKETPVETPAAAPQEDDSSKKEAPVDEVTPELPFSEEDLPSSAEDGLIKTLFPRPVPSCSPPPPAELTPEQQTKYDAVLEAVSQWTTVPTAAAKNSPAEPITDDERMWLTRECLLRYLRASKWNVTDAINRLLTTLTWRREYGLEKFTSEYISVENETGKQTILGFDNDGRPCLYLSPARQNTSHSDRQIHHLVFMLERVIDLMVPDQESLALLINFNETRSGQNATIGQGRQTLNILQNHYPERLGRALVTNMPFLVLGFFKLITPFIDPVTRQKLKFNEDLRLHVPPSQLLKSVGGDVEFEYDHSIYWPTLNKLAAKRRQEYRERWVAGGKLIGEHENYLRGGPGKSLAQAKAEQTTTLEEKLSEMEVSPQAANGAPQPQTAAA